MPRRQVRPKRCPRCDMQFETRSLEQRFCSRSCAARGPRPNRRRRDIEPKTCACGRSFVPVAPRIRFCSLRCGVRFGGRIREKRCPQCPAVFETKSAIQVYCSLRCQREARCARTVRFCEACGTPYHGIDIRRRFCSRNCAVLNANRQRGERAYNWKGGRTLTSPTNGYVRVRAPDHPRARKASPYVLEHLLVMERLLGRYLLPHERVHHKNGRRDDNRPENLELWKMKDPPGVRASDYHCAGCTCDQRPEIAGSTREVVSKAMMIRHPEGPAPGSPP